MAWLTVRSSTDFYTGQERHGARIAGSSRGVPPASHAPSAGRGGW